MFVSKLARLFNDYYPGSSLEGVALKAAAYIDPSKAIFQASDHIQCIEET